MNQMAGRVDSLLDQHAQEHDRDAAKPAMLDEIRMWIAVDPLLAELHKQYLDVRAHHARLKDRHGESDPICDVAADMEDSARCAVDTRIIELRQSGEGKAAMQAMIRKAHADREEALVAAEREKSAAYWKKFSMRRAPREAERPFISFYNMMVCIIILHQLADERNRLRMGDTFGLAAGSMRRLAVSG